MVQWVSYKVALEQAIPSTTVSTQELKLFSKPLLLMGPTESTAITVLSSIKSDQEVGCKRYGQIEMVGLIYHYPLLGEIHGGAHSCGASDGQPVLGLCVLRRL